MPAMLRLMACQMASLQLPPAYKQAPVKGKLSWSACKALRCREGMWLSFLLPLPRSCKMQVRLLEAVGVRSPSLYSHKGTSRVQQHVLCQLYCYRVQSMAIVTHVLAQVMPQVSTFQVGQYRLQSHHYQLHLGSRCTLVLGVTSTSVHSGDAISWCFTCWCCHVACSQPDTQ